MKRKRSSSTFGKDLVPLKKRKVFKMKIPKQLFKNIELKYLDTTLNTTAITTAGIIVNDTICNVVLGDDNNNRQGREITLKSIHFRGSILEEAQTNLASMSNMYRFIVYLDKQCNSSSATVTGILNTADEKAFNNLSNKKRFKIIYDEYFELRHEAQSVLSGPLYSTHRVQHKIEFHKKMNIPINYNGTNGGSVADITSNNIGVLAIASSANGGICDIQARIRFEDVS